MIITLDGPCGSGKSTLAQKLAQDLGFFYANSGYFYRSLAYLLVVEFEYDQAQLEKPKIEHLKFILHEDNFLYQYKDGLVEIFFSGNNITNFLKSSIVSHNASIISADMNVRSLILPLQEHFGKIYNLVTDGRDCGSEIYPHAEFKFYITAKPKIRAQRLHADLTKKGISINFEQVLQTTLDRDHRDTTRLLSPLKKAADAIEIDTSDSSIEQIIQSMRTIIQI
jgi:cytidylate kinase